MNDVDKLRENIIKIRIIESNLLSPEFDFLEIDEKGLLVNPYPVLGSLSVTYDKVQAASIINGLNKFVEVEGKGWIPYFEGVNEIYERVHREKPYTDRQFLEEEIRVSGFDKRR